MAIGTTNFPTALDTATELVEVTNNASTALTSAITNSQTTITVNDPGEFASSGFATIVDDLTTPTKIEIISYTGKSGSDLTGVTRGAQGTSAQAFSTGYVECRYTKGTHEALRGAIIAVETKLGYGSDTATNGQFLAGNGAGTSEWRALIAGDIPDLSATYATAGHNHSGVYQPVDADLTAIAALSADGFLKKTGGTWGMDSTAYGTGTVTSVALSLPAIFNVSGSPVTTTGTLAGALADQAANVVFAGPTTGAATTPTFRALVAADIPGVLSITKASNLTSNGFVKTSGGDGTLSVDTSTYLTGNQSISLSGDVTGSGSTAITATIANDAVTYAKMQDVSATSRILGRKTALAGNVEECTLSEVLDFIGSAAQGDILYRDASGWARLGAGTSGHYLQTQGAGANPQWAAATGGGGITIGTTAITSGTAGRILYETSGNVVGEIAGSSVDANGAVQFAATARSSGVAQYFRVNTPADTGLTASTESVGIYFGGNGSGSTVTRQFATGAITTQRENVFVAPTYAFASASTITNAYTLFAAQPVPGPNATFSARAAIVASTTMAGATPNVTSQVGPLLTIGTTGGVAYYAYEPTGTNILRIALERSGNEVAYFGINKNSATGGVPANALMIHAYNNIGGFAYAQGSGGNPGDVYFYINTAGLSGFGTNHTTLSAQVHVASASASRVGLRVDSAANSTVALNQFYLNADDTATVAPHSVFAVDSNGSVAAGFGGQLQLQLESSTTAKQDAAAINWLWTDSPHAHATRTAAITLSTVDNATSLAERWRLSTNGAGTGVTTTTTGFNGGTNVTGMLSENVTLSTGGTTTDSTIDLPANSIILSVTGRITTTITTATDWKLGDATVADRFSDANATLTAGTTTVGINQWKADRTTAGQGAFQQSTAKVRITTTGTPGAGAIRITIHYITLSAPTS